MNKVPHRCLLAISVHVALGAAVPALAQDTPASGAVQLEEVKVTAQRREEQLQKTPMSLTVIAGEQLDRMQIARLESVFEDGVIWHRTRLPTITVRADIVNGPTPATVVAKIDPTLDAIRDSLPAGYLMATGGSVEDSARGQNSIKAGMSLFLFVVVTLLMLQLRNVSRVLLVMSTAPLGLIGVVLFL